MGRKLGGIQGGRVIGVGNDVRLGSWANPIVDRLKILPESACRNTRHMCGNTRSPAPASGHSVRKYGCERGENDGSIRRVEQPARQRVQGFQVQRLPESAFSLVQVLFGRPNYRWTLSPSGA